MPHGVFYEYALIGRSELPGLTARQNAFSARERR